MTSPRQAKQKSVAQALRALAMMQARAQIPEASEAEGKALQEILATIEKRVRDDYRDYQRSYGSKNLIGDRWKTIQWKEQRDEIERNYIEEWDKWLREHPGEFPF